MAATMTDDAEAGFVMTVILVVVFVIVLTWQELPPVHLVIVSQSTSVIVLVIGTWTEGSDETEPADSVTAEDSFDDGLETA